ncbi:hypothetical protein ACYSUO_18620 [Streptomyces sp. UC4497]
MALNNNMPIRDPKRAETDTKHTTKYQASKGGYYPVKKDAPVPGAPKK